MADICITSQLTLTDDAAPNDAFTLNDVKVSLLFQALRRGKNVPVPGKSFRKSARTRSIRMSRFVMLMHCANGDLSHAEA